MQVPRGMKGPNASGIQAREQKPHAFAAFHAQHLQIRRANPFSAKIGGFFT
jgi:hypothetical protein